MLLGKPLPVSVTDRRHLRRAETIQELLDTAIQVMAEQGAGGLSLGEVARRMGIRTPSLYVYFPSKNAVYDEVFANGWRMINEVLAALPPITTTTRIEDTLQITASTFARWCVEHPVHAQLMIWRPVPNWEPSAEAYAPAVLTIDLTRQRLADLQSVGLLRQDVPLTELVSAWTVLIGGVISGQLANAPDQPFGSDSFTQTLPALVSMYVNHYRAKKRRTS